MEYFILGALVSAVAIIIAVRKSNEKTRKINERNAREIDRLHGTSSLATSSATRTNRKKRDDDILVNGSYVPANTTIFDNTTSHYDIPFKGHGGDFGGAGASSSWEPSSHHSSSSSSDYSSSDSSSSSSDSGSSGGGGD